MKTGIEEFDRLLGLQQLGMDPGTVMLIRGKPGSGKTTFALQILFNMLRLPVGEIHPSGNKKPFSGMLISLEVPPAVTLERFQRRFMRKPNDAEIISVDELQFKNTIAGGNLSKEIPKAERITVEDYPSVLLTVSADNVYNSLKEAFASAEVTIDKGTGNLLGSAASKTESSKANPHSKENPKNRGITDWALTDSFNRLFALLRGKSDEEAGKGPVVIVLDSLSALKNQFATWCPDRESPREAMAAFLKAVQNVGDRDTLLILLAEYDSLRDQSVLNESYLCDVEVALSSEPIAGHPNTPLNLVPSAGYDYTISRSTDSPERIAIAEVRSFCRVLKSRVSENQSRRCLYEIRSNRGLVFHEHFPGDGEVRLFEENAPQRKAWDEFLQKEVPRVYPSLRASRFDAITLQRTFGTLRHLLHHPERTDLLLGSFDSYWLEEFRVRHQRLLVEQFLSDAQAFQEGKDVLSESVALLQAEIRSVLRKTSSLEDQLALLQAAPSFKIFFPVPLTGDRLRRFKSLLGSFARVHGLFMPLESTQLRVFSAEAIKFIGDTEPRSHSFSVPYNNNVSVMVYRKDILSKIRGKLKLSDDGQETFCAGVRAAAQQLGTLQEGEKIPDWLLHSLWEHFLGTAEPKTWEEIFFLCVKGSKLMLGNADQDKPQDEQAAEKPFQVVIETAVFDTLAATFLELIWSCGGHPVVEVDYSVKDAPDATLSFEKAIAMAAKLLSGLARAGVIPENSTNQPAVFASSSPNWLFARHWHSTLVHLLTQCKAPNAQGNADFVWPGKDVELDLMPMPMTLRSFFANKATTHNDVHSAAGISTRGDWHLAILRTSENETLAYDLINNLMSMPKVIERAFTCAGIPTIKAFYESYGELPALNVRKRTGSGALPKRDFNWFMERFAKGRCRSEIYDFRTCMNCISPLIEGALRTSGVSKAKRPTLDEKASAAVKEIEALRKRRPVLY